MVRLDGIHDEMCIVSLQVVDEARNLHLLDMQSIIQIARLVSRSPVGKKKFSILLVNYILTAYYYLLSIKCNNVYNLTAYY